MAVAYSNGQLRLLSVEDAKKVFAFQCNEPIECLFWLHESDEMASKHETHNFYEDMSGKQLPKPISYDLISQLFEKANNREFPDKFLINESKNLTFLVCAHGVSIAIFVYGYFLLVDANLELVPGNSTYKHLKACYLSDNVSMLSTLGFTEENLLIYSLLDASILNENHVQIKMISTKFGIMFSMLSALKSVIKEMDELWEDILVEMDQKFQLYELERHSSHNGFKNHPNVVPNNNQEDDSSLARCLMELFAFGTIKEPFKTFLLNELTDKGLKKLENSVENYYSNIQRLLNGNFHQYIILKDFSLNMV